MKKEKPWLNSNRTVKSEEEIKKACKDWGMEFWNEYLQSFERGHKSNCPTWLMNRPEKSYLRQLAKESKT